MRIDLLLAREPFGDILHRTLERFLPTLTGREHAVRFRPQGSPTAGSALPDTGPTSVQSWLCNYRLNAIFLPHADRHTLDPVLREFSTSTVWWRRPLQKTYVRLSAGRRSAAWFAHARVEVTPPVRDADQWLIVPGNHKLRILDRRRGSVYAVLKDGFDPGFLRSEILARRTAVEHGVPVPRLLRTAEAAGWLEESYVSGTPWNRLTDPALAREVLLDASAALNGLADATARSTEVGRHAARLREQCHGALGKAKLVDANLRNDIESLLARVALLLEPSSSDRLETSTCHGDFQPANLLWDDRRLWLIDWEYSRRCQRGHDALVWGLATRWPLGLAGRLADFVRGETVRLEPVFSRFRSFDDAGTQGRQVAALLLILEELQLRLEESVHPCLVALHPTLSELVAESLAWLDGLETRH